MTLSWLCIDNIHQHQNNMGFNYNERQILTDERHPCLFGFHFFTSVLLSAKSDIFELSEKSKLPCLKVNAIYSRKLVITITLNNECSKGDQLLKA